VGSACGDQLRIIMANSRTWGSPQQQEMSDFDSANNFSPGEGFNIGEMSGMEGTYDLVLYVCCSEKRNLKHYAHYSCSSASTIIISFCIFYLHM
jgi:hypothetical protein